MIVSPRVFGSVPPQPVCNRPNSPLILLHTTLDLVDSSVRSEHAPFQRPDPIGNGAFSHLIADETRVNNRVLQRIEPLRHRPRMARSRQREGREGRASCTQRRKETVIAARSVEFSAQSLVPGTWIGISRSWIDIQGPGFT